MYLFTVSLIPAILHVLKKEQTTCYVETIYIDPFQSVFVIAMHWNLKNDIIMQKYDQKKNLLKVWLVWIE